MLPATIANVDQLEDLLSEPTAAVAETLSQLSGDYLVLGVAGKMGPTLARMIRRALDACGKNKSRVIGVARFSTPSAEQQLQRHGVETLRADLLNRHELTRLPEAQNIIYMAGMKFGSTGNESLTWAKNCYLPGMVCERYPHSRIVAFSTGNIYGLTPVTRGGSLETDIPLPLGDYAMSCLGRERIVDHFSRALKIPIALIRLNYAVEMRYGVLVDLARKVWTGEPVDVSMGHFNVIWQGDANAQSIAALSQVQSPANILNVTGPEVLSVRELAHRFGELLLKKPVIVGSEAPDALLNNPTKTTALFGKPRVSVDQLLRWTVDWIKRGGETLNKPTHFETRDGKF